MNSICAHITVADYWGRSTNRVIEMCQKHGAAPPVFEERQGFLIVTFRAPMVVEDRAERPRPKSTTQSTDSVDRLLTCLARGEMSAGEPRSALRIKHRPTFRANYLHPALAAGWIKYSLPDKPGSRLQKYQLTPEGEKALKRRGGKTWNDLACAEVTAQVAAFCREPKPAKTIMAELGLKH